MPFSRIERILSVESTKGDRSRVRANEISDTTITVTVNPVGISGPCVAASQPDSQAAGFLVALNRESAPAAPIVPFLRTHSVLIVMPADPIEVVNMSTLMSVSVVHARLGIQFAYLICHQAPFWAGSTFAARCARW